MLEYIHGVGRVTVCDGGNHAIAEITFPMQSDNTYVLDHTYVDPLYEGQGIGSRLVREAVHRIQAKDGKVAITCSFARAWFDRHPEYAHLLR